MKTRIFLKVNFVLIICSVSSLPIYAQNKTILELADQYSSTLKNFQAWKRGSSVEQVIRKGDAVAKKYDELESLSDTEYALLEKKMKGYFINRIEVLIIRPDVKFFINLSKRFGTRADVAFFVLLRMIRPDSIWPAYIEQQTDVTGCTIYGKGLFAQLYGQTTKFRSVYPKAYVLNIKDEIEEMVENFVAGTCACGSKADVQKELRLFVRTFPRDENTPGVKTKLKRLSNKGDFRFNCHSG